ncbi:hypothetical protein TRVL_03348 [Trypanosoma vivax]|nr:hypothetical protein TRVL_03348 [Trypanosoma vivax]
MGGNAQRRLCNQSRPVPLRCLAPQLDCWCRKCYLLSLPGCRLHLIPPMLVHCAGVELVARVSGAVPFPLVLIKCFFGTRTPCHHAPRFLSTRHPPHIYSHFDKSPANTAVCHRPNEHQCRCTSTPNTKMSTSPIEPFSDSS